MAELDLSDRAGAMRSCARRALAGHNLNPKNNPNIDLSGRTLNDTSGETGFEFTIAAHRDLCFASVDDLRLEHVILPSISTRRYDGERAAIIKYAKDRRTGNDPEWLAFFERQPNWPPKKLGAKQRSGNELENPIARFTLVLDRSKFLREMPRKIPGERPLRGLQQAVLRAPSAPARSRPSRL